MSYVAKPIFYYGPSRSTPEIKKTMELFFSHWLPMHSSAEDLKLYHYTSLDGLKGIINTRSIWFTHTSTLNDPTELMYGKQLVLHILNDAINKEKHSITLNLLHDLINYVNIFNTISHKIYVACFCESENLLSQWRSYSDKGGGYNIGLKFHTETKFSHNLSDFEEESYVILRKIIYDVEKQKELVSTYVYDIISSFKEALKQFKGQNAIPMVLASTAVLECVNILYDLILSFKNPVFQEENEWRLIKGMEANHKPELLRFRETNEGLIPYLDTYIYDDKENEYIFPLHKINFGPILDESRTKSVLELFLNKEAVSANKIKIEAKNTKISGAGYILRN